jgi:hypothetical protein
MRRTKIFLATAAVLIAMLAAFAAPAMADNRHNDNRDNDNCCNHNFFDRHDDNCCNDNFFDRHDVDDNDFIGVSPFIGFTPFVSVLDDLNTEQVGNNNPLEGDCVPTDLDFDGFIAEWEVTCFV